jgi:hypothetical protein
VAGEGLALLLVAGEGWRCCWWLEEGAGWKGAAGGWRGFGAAGGWRKDWGWLERAAGVEGEGLLERLLVAGEGLGLAGKGCWWLEKELLGPAGGWRKD